MQEKSVSQVEEATIKEIRVCYWTGKSMHQVAHQKARCILLIPPTFGNMPNTNISVDYTGTSWYLAKKSTKGSRIMPFKWDWPAILPSRGEMFLPGKIIFIPDLPKGYQLTQDKKPDFVVGGHVPIVTGPAAKRKTLR